MEAPPGPALRIAVLANLESPHARAWTEAMRLRGHEMHAISFYPPPDMPGVQVHTLRSVTPSDGSGPTLAQSATRLGFALLPPSARRLVQALRYRRAGLADVLRRIRPDVFHAHYVVEHGFFGATGFHPYVVSAWGSDVFTVPRTLAGRLVARHVLRRADLVTANDSAMASRLLALGAPPERVALVRLGIDDLFFAAEGRSANERPAEEEPPTVLSDRALEPLYNVDVILRAFARLRERLPTARLLVAGEGSQRARLEALAGRLGLGHSARFLGHLAPVELREALARAHVYVSVPSSDSLALSTLEAMAVGAFPVVSDLPSQEWIVHRVNGLRVPARSVAPLAEGLHMALTDASLRRNAVEPNRRRVRAEGRRAANMALMERHYYRLTGRPLADKGGL